MPRKPRQLPAQNTLPYLLLTLTALCGEYPIRQISHLPGGSAYLESVVTALRRDGLLRTFSKDGLRGLRLTSSAKRLLLADAPEWFSAYLTGSSEPNKLKSEIPRRLRLHRMAEILTIMHNADIPAFPWEKAPFSAASQSAAIPAYYTSREVKEIGPQGAKIKSSRATGILLTDGGIFLTYNTAKAQMKWEYKAELRFKALLQTEGVMPDAEISGIVFGSTMEQLSTDALTAEFISDRTGEASISVTSKAKQLGTWRVSNYTPEYRETSGVGRRKLMTMDEVLRMDIDKALILIRGKNVLEVDKYDYSKHPEAKKLRPSKAASHVPAWRANQPQEKQTPSAPPSQAADKKPAQKKKPASAEKVVAVTKESIMKKKEDT